MRRLFPLLLVMLPWTGCAALQRQAGEYVVDATKQEVERRVDEALAIRGVTRQEIVAAVGEQPLVDVIKETVKDTALAVAETKLKEFTEKHEDSPDPYSVSALIALVVAYLMKQVVTAKKAGANDARLAIIEKLVQKDINGDGKVG